MKRFIITGLAMSPPGSMGGNTKIALELARFLSKTKQVVIIIQKDKIKTITDTIGFNDNILIYPIEPFRHSSLLYLFHDAWHYTKELDKAFTALGVQPGEPVFNCSDFLSEAFSSFWLKPKFRFTWIPSTFLFFPSPWENLTRRYGFPLFLYTLAYIYQRIIFLFIKLRGDLFVITNDCDKAYFPRAWQQRIFAFYGGVNSEQIQSLAQEQIETKYDVVFCSRLCTQKGIMPFLDIWSRVIQHLPEARLAIIGNGVSSFEKSLHEKADKLKLTHTISWLGYVNNTDKYRVYRASRLFVHPTIYDNNGMVAAEALCAGLPVAMNDLPSLRDVYTTGCSKIDFSDYDVTAQRITHLLAEPTAYQQLKPTAQQLKALNTHWDWTNRCRLFERFCSQTLLSKNTQDQTRPFTASKASAQF
jgi:glycosyltransferase involved in cell wall biosynthesis